MTFQEPKATAPLNDLHMIFNFEKLTNYLADRFPLAPGDAIFTGTPSGVGPVKPGDVLDATCGTFKVQWKIK